MNKFFNILIFLLIFFAGCSPTPKKASEYNNKLIRQQRNVVAKMDDLVSSFSTYDPKEMNEAYDNLVRAIDQAIDSVENMKDFYGDDQFKTKTLELLNVYKSVTENEFRTVLNLLSKPENKYTNDDARIVSETMLQAKMKINKANQSFKEYQNKFADKYNLKLVD